MRDIRFRGKRVDNGELVYGYLLITHMSGCYILNSKIHTQKKRGGEITIGDKLEQFEVIPESVGQNTGRKDKNGKEIYEDDILHIEIFSQLGSVIASGNAVVKWENSSFGIDWGFRKEFTRFDGFCNTTFEVIGNIHENPELLN